MREPSGPLHALEKDAAQLRPFWRTPCVSCIRTVSMRLCACPKYVTQQWHQKRGDTDYRRLSLSETEKDSIEKGASKDECTYSMAYSRGWSIQERHCYIMYLATGDKGASQQLEPFI